MAVIATITIVEAYTVYGITSDAVQDADDYFAARIDVAEWDAAVTLGKQQAIITAARMIDRQIWSGDKTVTAQFNDWPRDSATCRGTAVTDGTIPDDIAYGEFELALALLKDADVQNNSSAGSNVRRAKAGSAEVEFFAPTTNTSSDTRFPTVVHELIGCYMEGNAATTAQPYGQGSTEDAADQESTFGSCDNSFEVFDGWP